MRRSVMIFLIAICAACCGGKNPGPKPIVWDREACAHCHMLISDPHYAAQLELADGEHLNFDDPGCLRKYVAENHIQGATMWFHHMREDRWIRGDAVAWVAAQTPMGYGQGAVDRVAVQP